MRFLFTRLGEDKRKEDETDMGNGIKFTVVVGVVALFGCIQLGWEQPGVKKGATASPQLEEEAVVKQPEASAPEEKKEAKSCCAAKKEETASHPTDKRTIQQITSEITGEKIGPDNSGDL